jgi:hypothetical protein
VLTRYLVRRVIPPALLINVVLNLVGGAMAYHDPTVPLGGNKSAGGDALFNALVIGFFTLLVVARGGRNEARAGRIRGFGRRFWRWPARHPVLAALAFGFLCVPIFGIPAVLALAHWFHAPLPRGTFLLLKAGYSGVVGAITAVVAALIGAAPEPPVEKDARWVPSATGLTYPCDYVDKGGLAVTSQERGCSGTPTWQLVVDGALDPAHVAQALADTARRYPSIATRVQSIDGVPPYACEYRYAHDPRWSVAEVFDVVDVRGDAQKLAALEHELHNRHLDLYTQFPVTLTLAITGDSHSRLFFRQHHAIADGRAFIELLVDFAAFLEAARTGRRPTDEALAPIGRRSEDEALGVRGVRRLYWTVAGYRRLFGAMLSGRLRPSKMLLQNRSNDYSGENGVVHWLVDADTLAGWERARTRLGVSLNSLLTAALFEANRRWHAARGENLRRVTGSLVMETRPQGFRSFANHLATLELDVRVDRAADLGELARTLHAQVKRQRAARGPEKRLLAEKQLVALMSIAQMQQFVFETRHADWNLNFSNLIGLPFPALGGTGWRVDEVRICTPVTPRTGIALTVIRYRDRLCFNFNYKATAATRADAEAVRAGFEAALREIAGEATVAQRATA